VFYWRSFDQGHDATLAFSAKQKLSFDQAYAYNYQQRHPTRFTGNAFTEYKPLLRQVFGKPEPTLLQGAFADPRAVGAFVLWNARLLPSGLQVAMFGATSSSDQPDYVPVTTQKSYALFLSVLLLIVLCAGGMAMRSKRKYWRRHWLPPRSWIILLLSADAVTGLFVVLIEQRPRPEYMYGLTVGILAVSAVCVKALLQRFGRAQLAAPVALGLALGLLVFLPSYFTRSPRPLYNAINRLQVARSRLRDPGSVLIAANANFELCAYLAETNTRHCESPGWPTIQAELTSAGASASAVLDKARATVIYAEPLLLATPAIARLVADPGSQGWRQVGAGDGPEGPWHVLVRTD
jgi:hypothetical protein